MPHLLVSGIYMTLQAMCRVLFIIWPNYYTFFIEIAVLVAMYLVLMKKYYHLHLKKKCSLYNGSRLKKLFFYRFLLIIHKNVVSLQPYYKEVV